MDATDCAVRTVRSVGSDAIAIDLATPATFEARPGQFVKLTFELPAEAAAGGDGADDATDDGDDESEGGGPDEDVSRFYTISSPDVDDTFEITVEVDPEGEVGPLLADLEPGDEVTVSGPYGKDYYEDEDRVVVLAGGPGVGPAVGIAERALADGGEAAVIYRDDDPIHEDRLAALAEAGASVSVLDADADLAEPVAAALADGGQVFVYGFAEFIDAATDAVEAAGADSGTAKIENFG